MTTWTLLIVYATAVAGVDGIGATIGAATSIPGFKSEDTCLEAKKQILKIKDLWKNSTIKPFGIDCIKVQ